MSPSGLRRLAGVYAELYGELPKDSSGTSRLWSPEAVNRLEAARALMAAGQARSIKDALLAVEGGAAPPVEAMVSDGRIAEALGMVAARLEALQASNERLESEVAALRSEVVASRALPEPGQAGDVEGRSASVESPGDGPSTVAGVDDGPVVGVARWLERWLRGRG